MERIGQMGRMGHASIIGLMMAWWVSVGLCLPTGAAEALAASATKVAIARATAADQAADQAWSACQTAAELSARQASVQQALLAAIGPLPAKTPLNAQTLAVVPRDGYTVEKVLFESEPSHHVTANLFLPDPQRFPGKRAAVLIPCGHSLSGKGFSCYQRGAVQLVERGMVALICDPLDQGERRQSRQRPDLMNVWAHNDLGRRAALLGWSMARFRIRDGVRALDYLASRPEVDASRLGVAGHSGGGTMTAWLMALDERVRCAAPSGFITSLAEVFKAIGPQDAEQFVFGELAFGFNHLGHILLRAPSPVLHCATDQDFFPIAGARSTAALALATYVKMGAVREFRFSEMPGPHHWHESTRTYATDWLDLWLQGSVVPVKNYAALTNDYEHSDVGLGKEDPDDLGTMRAKRGQAVVTPKGEVLELPGERSAYDLMREELKRLRSQRAPLTPAAVRKLAKIRPVAEISASVVDRATHEDGTRSELLKREDGTLIPLLSRGTGEQVLVVAGTAQDEKAALLKRFAREEAQVTVADLRGFGATSGAVHAFYGLAEDEELGVLDFMLGQPLVGARAEDLIAVARRLGGKVRLIAIGRAAIPAAHAFYTARELFSGLQLQPEEMPAAWESIIENEALPCRFADVVFGALGTYDWPDLVGVGNARQD